MSFIKRHMTRDVILTLLFGGLTLLLLLVPTGFEQRLQRDSLSCRGRVIEVDNSEVKQVGIVKIGFQSVDLELVSGRFKGREVRGINQLLGKMEMDKLFSPGDSALVVLTLDEAGGIIGVNPQDHYRLDLELLLFGLFAALLLVFGGFTGARALMSFVFSALMIWKVLIPAFLKGYDPILVSLAVMAILTAAIIFMVAGLTRKGYVAFLGSMAGIVAAGILSLVFTSSFHLHGAIKPFAETLLYTGFGHLNLGRILSAAVFIGCSGAMMDLAMDVSASIDEISFRAGDISRRELIVSGLRVGRAVVGTMTTTLLFAYSGGYITLLMVFMAQGVPLTNLFNIIYVAAEIMNTLVGSFGLVLVAPFTAIIGGLVHGRGKRAAAVPDLAGEGGDDRAEGGKPLASPAGP
ncbi:MAG: YibE/F family protein [Pseudomonadota bacterium]